MGKGCAPFWGTVQSGMRSMVRSKLYDATTIPLLYALFSACNFVSTLPQFLIEMTVCHANHRGLIVLCYGIVLCHWARCCMRVLPR